LGAVSAAGEVSSVSAEVVEVAASTMTERVAVVVLPEASVAV
jgi:hypothetical protein